MNGHGNDEADLTIDLTPATEIGWGVSVRSPNARPVTV
jgi:hypothetical protein